MLLAALCVLLSLAAVPVQSNAAGGELRSVHVRDHIYMLNGADGNVGVSIGRDGILLVDSKLAPLADRLRAALAGLGGGKLVYLLNTHFHADHVGGNTVLGTEGTIIAHDRVRHRLLAGPEAQPAFLPAVARAGPPHAHLRQVPVPPLQRRDGQGCSLSPLPHRRRHRRLLHAEQRGPPRRSLLQWSFPLCRPGLRGRRRKPYTSCRRNQGRSNGRHEDHPGSWTPGYPRGPGALPPHAGRDDGCGAKSHGSREES